MVFRDYYFEGLSAIHQHNAESSEQDSPKILFFISDTASKVKELVERQRKQLEELSLKDDFDEIHSNRSQYDLVHHLQESTWTRKQCDMYISKQVELIQFSEAHADSPQKVAQTIKQILANNPDLPQVHYLSYMNALRTNDFCEAMKSLYLSFDQCCKSSAFHNPEFALENDKPTDEADRYAALNVAAMHARFGHNEEALLALKEAIMMAQESNDHMCLQHALMWLFRIQPKQRPFLMERCISKCNNLGVYRKDYWKL